MAGLPLAVPVNPGGLPLYRGSRVIGGIGVAGVSPDRAEFAAAKVATGAAGTGITTAIAFPAALPVPGAVFIDGLRLPFFANCISSACVIASVAGCHPALPEEPARSETIVAPRGGMQAPEGYLIGPFASTTPMD